jgi:hypothetical protein
MANKVKIARSGGASGHTAVTAPTGTNLEYGELGWLNGTNRLFIGRATADPTSSDGSPAPYEVTRTATAIKTGMAGFVATDFDISAFVPADGTGGIVSIKDNAVTNALLTNDGITIGATDCSLGGTTTAFTGLTSLDVTVADVIWAGSLGENTLTLGGSDSTVAIAGDLTVAGTTTTVSSTNLEITDKKIQLGKGAATQAALDDIGIYGDPTVGTDVSFLVSNSGTKWTSNVPIVATLEGTATSTPSLTGLATGTLVGRFDPGVGAHETKTLAAVRGLMISAGTNVAIAANGTISATDTNTQNSAATTRAMFAGGTNVTLATNGTISSTDTNTHRTVTAGGNTLTTSETLAFTAGTNIAIAETGGAVTITATDTNTQNSAATTRGFFSAGANVTISSGGEIASSYTNTQNSAATTRGFFSAGANVAISTGGEISATNTVGATSAQVTAIGLNTAKTSDINHNVSTNLSVTATGTAYTTVSSDGDDAAHTLATTSAWGVMSDEMFDTLGTAIQPGDVIDGGTVVWT